MPTRRSEFDFHKRRTLGVKLGRTFLLMIAGAFFLIFTALVFHPDNNPWWLILLKIALEICWTFWLFAVLYVWFEWTWLRLLYSHSERRFLALAHIAKWALPFFAVITIGFIWYLTRIGVLPLPPK